MHQPMGQTRLCLAPTHFDHEYHSDVAVATCRQTVDALLAPHHRLAADGYDSTRSHLSPDGGGLTRADHLEAHNALNA